MTSLSMAERRLTAANGARVAIVVLNFNGLDDTVRCLESLKAVRAAATVILVDNGSTDDPAGAATAVYPDVQMVHNGTNLGYAGGNNRGIALALSQGAEYVIVLNNDTVVAPTLVDVLIAAMVDDPRLGIVGPVINYMDEPERMMTEGVRFNPGPGVEFFQPISVPVHEGGPGVPVPVDIVNGCCMMIRASVLRAVGSFDERLFIVHEESDLCLRAKRAGFTCAVVPRVLVWHKGSSAFERSGRQWQRYFDTRNLLYLLLRHGGRVGQARGPLVSAMLYLRYAYYRQQVEVEAGKEAAAQGVLDGLSDAMLGRTGPYVARRRPLVPALRVTFKLAQLMTGARRYASSLL
jgi:GT2 family glycosyltransferase